jgi:hypothetical protein
LWNVELYSLSEFFFIIILVCEAIGTAASPGLLCQPRVIVKMIVEKQMECSYYRILTMAYNFQKY